jgi:hypothetical protein
MLFVESVPPNATEFGNTRPSPLTAFRRSPMPLTGGGIIPSLPCRRREHCLPELLADLVMAVMPPRLPAALDR